MNNSYMDLVQQTFNFPQEGFQVKDGYLRFNGLDLRSIIEKYGTPLKLSYLPKIGMLGSLAHQRRPREVVARSLTPSLVVGLISTTPYRCGQSVSTMPMVHDF